MNINIPFFIFSVLLPLFGAEEELGKLRLGTKCGRNSAIVPKTLTLYCK
jgi:hypothetical protein